MTRWIAVLTLGVALLSSPAFAIDPEERLADPALEAQARDIAKQLRCVVCDNASIDDSDAQVAKDMRTLVRKRVSEGKSEAEIKQEFVSYYGEYVLLQPRFTLSNLFIWLATPIALLFGLYWIWRRTTPGPEPVPDFSMAADDGAGGGAAPLSDAENRRLDELLKDDGR